MINSLQKRFILYTMLVISSIILVMVVLVIHSTGSDQTFHRTLIFAVVLLLLVFVGSVLLSKLAVRPVKKSWQRQLDFTADASHELRTPLAVIRSNLEIVMENQDELVSEQNQWLQYMHLETERMSKLVEDLLFLSRADAAEQEVCLQTIPLAILVQDRISAYRALAEEHEIGFASTLEDSLMLQGDPDRISQLLSILIDNAIQYMNRPGTITISGEQKGRWLHLCVMDDGEGISREDQDKVFLRFYRGDRSRSSGTGGSGLGLSIAKRIVEMHHGRIRLASTPGVGTKIEMIFML